MAFSSNCFDNVVGFSRRDCGCFETGRPEGVTEVQTVVGRWEYQTFTVADEPADPYTFATSYDTPADIAAKSQLFAAGQLLTAGVDYTRTGVRQITVANPVPGATYQFWYEAQITAYENVPAYNYSLSGLFLSDLVPETLMDGFQQCEETIWDMMEGARIVAIKETIAALNTTIMRKNTLFYKTWQGYIGETKGTERLATSSQYAGIRIRTNGIRSGYLRLVKFVAMFEDSGTLTLTIYDGDGNVVTPSFNITTAGGGRSVTPVNITLPLLGDYSTVQDYFIVYTYSAGNRGILNKVFCKPCGGVAATAPTYNVEAYRYQSRDIRGVTAWHNFIALGGWEGDSVADFSDAPDELGVYMNGLAVEVELGCDMAAGICGMVSGFGSNPYAMSMATAIQRKWASTVVRSGLRSPLPNRNLQVNREQLTLDANRWDAEFAEIMNYLSTNIPDGANDCVQCKPRVSMQSILT